MFLFIYLFILNMVALLVSNFPNVTLL